MPVQFASPMNWKAVAEEEARLYYNENMIESRIQDVKYKPILVIQQALVIFWYHVFIYVVDCLNYKSKETIWWKNAIEVLNGNMADIAPFRLKFWKSVKFIENTQFLDI